MKIIDEKNEKNFRQVKLIPDSIEVKKIRCKTCKDNSKSRYNYL